MESRTQGFSQGHKKIRGIGQGQPFRGQTLSRPRTGMLEAKAKDQGHRHKCSPKKSLQIFFQAISFWGKQKRCSQIFREVSGVFQRNFNCSKNSAVLEPRTGQFSRTWGFETKAKDFKICPRGRPRGQGRLRGLHLCNRNNYDNHITCYLISL